MEQMKESFEKATERIKEIDDKEPEFVNKYREKYMEARRQSGIPDDNNSFIQYLGLDLAATIESAPTLVKK
jgi:lipopolysaccharide biosynthesis regulator YciM